MPRSHTTELRSGCINTSLEGRGEESQEVIKLKYHSTESFGPLEPLTPKMLPCLDSQEIGWVSHALTSTKALSQSQEGFHRACWDLLCTGSGVARSSRD